MRRNLHGRKTFSLQRMPSGCSCNARLAFDVLTGGEHTALGIEYQGSYREWLEKLKKIGTTSWIDVHNKVLADFIRSGEPIPNVFRSALADAIDGQNDPPVRISLRNERKYPLLATVMAEGGRARYAVDVLEAAQERGCGYDDAKAVAAKAVGTNERDIGSLLSLGRLLRDRDRAILEAYEARRPMSEIGELIHLAPPRSRPGRRSKSQKT